jgi:hypothetical protein
MNWSGGFIRAWLVVAGLWVAWVFFYAVDDFSGPFW